MVVTGIEGLPNISKAGNVMLPYTAAKVSIRLPPTKDPEEAKKTVMKVLSENPPYNAKVTLTGFASGSGFNNPTFPEPLQTAIS